MQYGKTIPSFCPLFRVPLEITSISSFTRSMYPQNQKQDIFSKLFSNKKLLFLVIGGFIILVLAIVTLAANSGSKTPGKLVAMQTHLAALAEFSRDQGDTLNDADLRDQNANLSILLIGASNDIGTYTLEAFGEIKPDATIAARSATRVAELETITESALNTNTVDTVYRQEMINEVTSIEAQLVSYGADSGTKGRALLESILTRMQKGREALEETTP